MVYHAVETRRWRREIDEEVLAGYLMGSVDVGQVSLLGGFRVEETRTDAEGPVNQVTPEEAARRAAWSGPVTILEQVRRAEAAWDTRQRATGKYRSTFPSFHVKYEPMPASELVDGNWPPGFRLHYPPQRSRP